MLQTTRPILLSAVVLALTAGSAAQQLCASSNTGSGFSSVTNLWQSHGACSLTCGDEYAFAIVQFQSCWCSNVAPSSDDTVSTGDCNEDCPGYPDESCGNASNGLFGYIPLGISPTATAGGGAASSPSPSSSIQTTPSPSPSSNTPSSSSVRISSTISTSSNVQTSTSRTLTPTISTSMRVVTESGSPVTQTVTVTGLTEPTSARENDGQLGEATNNDSGGGVSGGAIAGIVVGVVAGVALVVAAVFFFWRRKRNQEFDEKAAEATSAGTSSPGRGTGSAMAAGAGVGAAGAGRNIDRNTSVLSKTALLSRGRPTSMNDNGYDDHSGPSMRSSTLFNGGHADGVNPASPLGENGKPLVYDQRLNPSALFASSDANGSRVSMQDNNDYSRPLGVTNPDPRNSFDSHTSRR